MNARIESEGFVDIWRERHPTERAYTGFNRHVRRLDAARVDYILVSADLVPRIVNAEILPLLPWRDHAPIAIGLKARDTGYRAGSRPGRTGRA